MSKSQITRHLSNVFFLTPLLLSLSITALAQSNKGAIKGTVSDQNKGIVQNASVTATNNETNAERTVNTGDDGTYEFPLLDPGTYKITVKASNFADTLQDNVVVQTASTSVVDVSLSPATVGGVVTVSAGPSLL